MANSANDPDWVAFKKMVKNILKTGKHVEVVKPAAPRQDEATVKTNYMVKVTADVLNIRKGPGTKYAKVGVIKDKGTYTIVKEKNKWGLLKSGEKNEDKWISLAYTKEIK